MVFLTVFLIYFGMFPPYYQVFFRLFGPKLREIMMFFFLGKRRIMRFLARITDCYRVLFLRFLTYNKCDFEHFRLFF